MIRSDSIRKESSMGKTVLTVVILFMMVGLAGYDFCTMPVYDYTGKML